jgi:hypothetical protein
MKHQEIVLILLTEGVFETVKQKISMQQIEISEKTQTLSRLRQKLEKLRISQKEQIDQT